jgi:hypothetical protein
MNHELICQKAPDYPTPAKGHIENTAEQGG